MDPVIGTARTAIAGLKEAIKVGKEFEEVTQEIADLGKAELQARAAARRKAAVKNPETHFVEATKEFHRFKEVEEIKAEMYGEIERKWGKLGLQEVEKIEKRMAEDYKRMYTEDGLDREKLFRVKFYCFLAAAIITAYLWYAGIIHEMAVVAYGE
mgnify:CR=1 FL=1